MMKGFSEINIYKRKYKNWQERNRKSHVKNMQLKALLLGVEVSKDAEDKWCWLPDTTRGFTVKSCYKWLCFYFAGNGGFVNHATAEACKNFGEMMSL